MATKRDIATIMSNDLYEHADKSEVSLDAAIRAIKRVLRQGKSLQIRGFGTFNVRSQVGKSARNFRTGEHYLMDPRMVVRFKPSKKILKEDEA